MPTLALHWPSDRLFFFSPVLCRKLDFLVHSSCCILLFFKMILLFFPPFFADWLSQTAAQVFENSLSSPPHLLNAMTCTYPTLSHSKTQLRKLASFYTFCHQFYTCFPAIHYVPLSCSVRAYVVWRNHFFMGPYINSYFRATERTFVSQKHEQYQ